MIYIAIALGLLLISIVYIYNVLVKNRNRMEEAWSIIDVFLRKRHDLIPALVEVVKGYSIHEKSVLEEVTRYRTEAMQAGNTQSQIDSETGLEKSLGRLLVTVENYPDLKANQQFLNLQRQITDVENELETARRYYNGTVRENNISLESFPSNLVGSWFHFSKGVFFAAEAEEKALPNVSF